MHFRYILLAIFYFNAFGITIFAQQENLYLNREKSLTFEKKLNQMDKASFHSAIKPYIASEVYDFVYPDSVIHYTKLQKSDWFSKMVNVVGFENFLEFDENGYVKYRRDIVANPYLPTYNDVPSDTGYVNRKFYVAINPIINIGMGVDFYTSKIISQRTVGFELKADIGKKVSLYTAITNNVVKFPSYITLYSVAATAVPGEGRTRPTSNNSFDYSSAIAYLSYSPVKQFNMQIGNGKHFIGDGFRSLLLSDNSFNYPYLQFTTNVWRIKYTTIYTELLNNIKRGTDFTLGYQRKLATFNYLSVDAAKWLQLGVFEGITWRRTTDKGNTFFDYNFINPILGVRAFQKKLNPNINKVYGTNIKVTLPKNIILYGQFAAQSWGKKNTAKRKTAFQVGMKYFEVGNVPNLNLQVEFNQVRPFMYQGLDSLLSYSNYNQSITHSMGANFREYLATLNYQWKRLYTSYKFNFTQAGYDFTGDFLNIENNGGNILKAEKDIVNATNVKMFNGTPYNIINNEFRIGYIINPKINFVAELGVQFRNYSSSSNDFNNFSSHSIGLSFKTNIFNRYYDLPVLF
ncbi:MAG: hypothetical protein R2760_08120 [Chitinophagales bacterium]